jgi:NAD(P)-dependent dehydrogenase (short-subunit alcohol dehydrogenase family)
MSENIFDLKNKRFLVTGASSGIGRDVSKLITDCNGVVVITGRDEERLNETFSMLQGDQHQKILCDLTNEKQFAEMIAFMPAIDGIVHSAGITEYMPAKFINAAHMEKVFSINFKAPVFLTQKLLALKKINKGSSIVFLSSVATKHAYFGGSMYSGSKKALEGFALTLALELAGQKTRVNCVSPAMVKTEMLDKAAGVVSEESIEQFRKLHPLGFGEARDVSSTIVFLLSEASKWITGQNIILGGL